MSPTKTSGPWAWRPDKAAWFRLLGEKIPQWLPAEGLSLDHESLKHHLIRGAAEQSPWLLHPCVNALTLAGGSRRVQRDFQLALWAAIHVPAFSSPVTAPEQLFLWSPLGSYQIEPGAYEFRELADMLSSKEWPYSISLDVWCHSLGFTLAGTWAERQDINPVEEEQLKRELSNSLQALSIAYKKLPACVEWAADVTRVVVPLHREGENYFRSGSQKELPGLIYADLFGGLVQIMEAIVHESAHWHLFLAETTAPLVDPEHQGRYASPLRPEPRPLRGILLAYHAIAYICALYVEVLERGLGQSSNCEAELQTMRKKLTEAEAVLDANSMHLTAAGVDFLSRTKEVAHHGHHAL